MPAPTSPPHTAPEADFAALRAEMCRVGRSLFERGYVHATAGNISVRLPEGAGFLITPTDACLGFLRPERLAHVGRDGTQHSGDRASKTLALHRRIYESAPEAGCVIHTHSTHLVALTLSAGAEREGSRDAAAAMAAAKADDALPPDLLPPITPYFVMKVGHVPLIPYHRPGDPAAAERVAAAITAAAARGKPLRAVMLDRLGPNVWHASPAEAMATLEELEETAKLWLMCSTLPEARRPRPLSEPQIEELRRQFGARW